jgi:hypothetical protein
VTKALWAVDIMMRENMTWTVTLPPTIRAGNYIARFEILALQVAAYGGAEVYPACINFEVRSDGTEDPEGIKMTEFYRDLEAPGLKLNLYMPFTEYVSLRNLVKAEFDHGVLENSGTASLEGSYSNSTSITELECNNILASCGVFDIHT